MPASGQIRLQRFLADAGVASRRGSEQVILAGQVTVNGQVVRELGTKIDPAKDHVFFEGQRVRPKRRRYLALNKPVGYICTQDDPEGRKRALDLIPKEWANVQTVGRLDWASEGLIFLTNDGQFALRMTHPRYGISKTYEVKVRGAVSEDVLEQLKAGVVHEGERLRADEARIVRAGPNSTLVELVLREGKNREIRRLFESQGLPVERLRRVQIGPVKLGNLAVGRWRTLTGKEIQSLLETSQPAKPRTKRK